MSRKVRARSLVAMAISGLLVIGVIGSAAGTGSLKPTVKSLNKKLNGLAARVSALENKPPGTPTGPAGGDLTGTYPNPTIGANAVGSAEIAADSVGGTALKGTTSAVSAGVAAAANTYTDASVTCPAGTTLMGGGFAWQTDAGISMVYSTPDPLTDPNKWIVRGASDVANTLYAWATCLAA